ncbi:MAG TPA: hypothetical protein PL131_04655 [Methylotenera sp.]|nr:hypothetical protein [Methylotenera sp.]HPH05145.1 hypothetical protein [Methylotenera sp.]HPN00509.1 hypothetical protein [Methylotenera sp.]
MKVKELIVMLEQFDENLDVVCVTKDVDFLDINQSLKMLEIISIEPRKTKLVTAQDKLPSVKLKQTSTAAETQIVIEMTGGSAVKNTYTHDRRRGVDRRSARYTPNSAAGFRF